MIVTDLGTLAPYFRNGLLYFPEKTINALLEVGLDCHVAERARRGLSLDDSNTLTQIGNSVDELLRRVDANSPFFSALASDEAYFMLTGKPLNY